ncbi:Chromo [Glarea lozoyensis ATCC 20868]|uniref:Chromo n=1 Tax=Glarea lozoyensis (strain ATCC 20868 / MF5171) TaxID=1116229 RepID=S3CNJ7_GLAL2|nr:Chromo [Glarea lozoyensis ATCC 20868]EPE28082.1 Chromo [Glarea lozoyensis ATCC 20868]
MTTEFLSHSGDALLGRSTHTSYFDFVIAERPIYIPNSGPPLSPLSIMPSHDKDGVIEDEISRPDGTWFYVVTYPEKPALRVSVKPQNILKWVSRRTLEEWDIEESKRKEEVRADAEREVKMNASRGVEIVKPKQRRKRKGVAKAVPVGKRRSSAAAGPARMRQLVEEETAVFTSPTKSQKAKGPSLTNPQASVLAGLDDSGEEIDEDELAIAAQLRIDPRNFISRNSRSRSTTAPPRQTPSSSSTPRRTAASPSASTAPSPFFSSRNPTAASSSLTAYQTFESLERQSQIRTQTPLAQSPKKNMTIAQKYSSLPRAGPNMFNLSTAASHSSPLKSVHKPYSPPNPDEALDRGDVLSSSSEEEGESEWEVDTILDDTSYIDASGVRQTYYLIKWVGDWDDSWEPVENVSEGVVGRYLAKKGSSGGEEKSQGKGKGKEKIVRREEEAMDEVSEKGLFVSDDDAGMHSPRGLSDMYRRF